MLEKTCFHHQACQSHCLVHFPICLVAIALLQPGLCYSKSSVFTSDACLMPHLEMEMGVTAGKDQLLLMILMAPRLSLVR
jgi:hypothetical protein